MNLILDAITQSVADGKPVIGITLDNMAHPTTAILHFGPNSTIPIFISKNRQVFMETWKHATRYIKLMKLLDFPEDLDDSSSN